MTQDTHRGWDISHDPGRLFNFWTATAPDFDVEYIDGQAVPSGGYAHGNTRAELIAEIDAWIEEHA